MDNIELLQEIKKENKKLEYKIYSMIVLVAFFVVWEYLF